MQRHISGYKFLLFLLLQPPKLKAVKHSTNQRNQWHQTEPQLDWIFDQSNEEDPALLQDRVTESKPVGSQKSLSAPQQLNFMNPLLTTRTIAYSMICGEVRVHLLLGNLYLPLRTTIIRMTHQLIIPQKLLWLRHTPSLVKNQQSVITFRKCNFKREFPDMPSK